MGEFVNRPLALTAIGTLIVVVAIGLSFFLGALDEKSDTPPANVAAPPNATPKQAPQAKAKPDTDCIAPSFDVVRINPFGDSVMAGRAAPGAKVKVLDGGKAIGEIKADPRGEWVFVPTTALPPGGRKLSLSASLDGCAVMVSESDVILVVPEKGKDIAGRETTEPSAPLALKVPAKGKSGAIVLQKPGAPSSTLALTFDIVDYDNQGHLSLSGHAKPGAAVQLYLDNSFLGRATSSKSGIWVLAPERTVSPGLYTLRADHVDTTGAVLARASIPFSRSDLLGELKPGGFVIVQPGHSLWRLAREAYGDGFNFSTIYEANKKQIQNPDLIFPGQIFALPPGAALR